MPTPATVLVLTRAQLALWEALTGGWLPPLTSFMSPAEVDAAARRGQGPITLDVPAPVAREWIGTGLEIRDHEGVLLGEMTVEGVAAAPWAGEAMVHLHGPLRPLVRSTRHDHADLRLARTAVPFDDDPLTVVAGEPISRDALAEIEGQAGEGPIVLLSAVGDAPPDDYRMHTVVRTHRLHAERLRRSGRGVTHALVPLPSPATDLGGSRWALATSGQRTRLVTADHGQGYDTDVDDLLRRRHPAADRAGLTIFFTGLSGSGKSTVAGAVMAHLHAETDRTVTLLDGDVVRTHLSSELTFSREHRDLNITRIGFVAAEVTKHRGVAICAPIAPYDDTRRRVRAMVEAHGTFMLVHVATPLEVCEARDRKGLYAKARAGEITAFTGITDPYEAPTDAELVIDTTDLSIGAAANAVMAELRRRELL